MLSSKLTFSKNSFRNTVRVLNSLDIDQDFKSVVIWVQTVCKGYELTTKVTAGKERVNF